MGNHRTQDNVDTLWNTPVLTARRTGRTSTSPHHSRLQRLADTAPSHTHTLISLSVHAHQADQWQTHRSAVIFAFTAAGPCRLWNSLPTGLSAWFVLGNLLPKTKNVFNCLRHQHLVTVAFRRCVFFAYLLTSSHSHSWEDVSAATEY